SDLLDVEGGHAANDCWSANGYRHNHQWYDRISGEGRGCGGVPDGCVVRDPGHDYGEPSGQNGRELRKRERKRLYVANIRGDKKSAVPGSDDEEWKSEGGTQRRLDVGQGARHL